MEEYVSDENMQLILRALVQAVDKQPLEFFRDIEALDRRMNLTGTDRSLAKYVLCKAGITRKELTEDKIRTFMQEFKLV